jgi:hypothetical protein
MEAQLDLAAALAGLDEHRVGIVDDVPGQVFEHPLGQAADEAVALRPDLVGEVILVLVIEVVLVLVEDLEVVVFLVFELVARVVFVAHLAFAAMCCSHAPEMVRRRCTCSVGWAPLRSQSSALSLSMSTRGGSSRGPYFPMISTKRPSRGERASATTTR